VRAASVAVTAEALLVWVPGLFVAIGGLLIGSFLNVVVWRVPRGESIVSPPSACPACGHRIRGRDNVPVLSWLVLHGRCRDCGSGISARYPLVEAGTCVAFALVWLRFGWSIELVAYLVLVAAGIALALIDLDVHRLPNAIVLPLYPVLLVVLGLASLLAGEPLAWLRALGGGAILYGLYFVLMVAKPGAMGFGDVKLAGVLGMGLAWLGWGSLAVGGFAAFLFGGIYSIVLLVAGRGTRTSGVPFGPWMIIGAAVGVGFGEMLWSGYLALLG
jgi:leader peptidase (prepilin peptidase)/N-methyltransferase